MCSSRKAYFYFYKKENSIHFLHSSFILLPSRFSFNFQLQIIPHSIFHLPSIFQTHIPSVSLVLHFLLPSFLLSFLHFPVAISSSFLHPSSSFLPFLPPSLLPSLIPSHLSFTFTIILHSSLSSLLHFQTTIPSSFLHPSLLIPSFSPTFPPSLTPLIHFPTIFFLSFLHFQTTTSSSFPSFISHPSLHSLLHFPTHILIHPSFIPYPSLLPSPSFPLFFHPSFLPSVTFHLKPSSFHYPSPSCLPFLPSFTLHLTPSSFLHPFPSAASPPPPPEPPSSAASYSELHLKGTSYAAVSSYMSGPPRTRLHT